LCEEKRIVDQQLSSRFIFIGSSLLNTNNANKLAKSILPSPSGMFANQYEQEEE
jgi:hypothetical protein